jgi:CubicO group peptidase (beta-lactamase class C family)
MSCTRVTLVAGAIIALAIHAHAATEPDPAPRTLDELKARATAIIAETHIPGAGIALVTKDDGIVWAGGIGKADVEHGRDVTAETLFRVGSVSKCFVALALLGLTGEGKLALNQRLKDLAPEIPFTNTWEPTHPVTVAQLLEHTAGFDDTRPMEIYGTREDLPLAAVLAVNPRGRVSRWPPGTRYSYSNPGYTILGYLIEKASGRAFEDYIRDTLLLPLGMAHADFRHTPAVAAQLARGYIDQRPTPVAYKAEQQRPAGQLHASPIELAHLVELWLGRDIVAGRPLFSADAIASLRRQSTVPAAPLPLAYGLANGPELVHGWVAHGHSGAVDGFLSSARYIPERGVGWVLLINTSAPGDGMSRLEDLIARYLLHDAPPPPAPTGPALAPAELARYVGYYEYANSRQEALRGVDDLFGGRTVFIKDGQLWAKDFLATPERLVPTGVPGGFRGVDDPITKLVFAQREDGDVMVSSGYRIKRSPWPILLIRGIVFGAGVLMASSLLWALYWLPRWLLSRQYRARVQRLRLRLLSLGASLLGFFAIALLSRSWDERDFVPIKNVLTVSLFLVPSLFAFAAVLALAQALKSITRHKNLVAVHSLLVALAACALAAWMARWGWIGVRVWSY